MSSEGRMKEDGITEEGRMRGMKRKNGLLLLLLLFWDTNKVEREECGHYSCFLSNPQHLDAEKVNVAVSEGSVEPREPQLCEASVWCVQCRSQSNSSLSWRLSLEGKGRVTIPESVQLLERILLLEYQCLRFVTSNVMKCIDNNC